MPRPRKDDHVPFNEQPTFAYEVEYSSVYVTRAKHQNPTHGIHVEVYPSCVILNEVDKEGRPFRYHGQLVIPREELARIIGILQFAVITPGVTK